MITLKTIKRLQAANNFPKKSSLFTVSGFSSANTLKKYHIPITQADKEKMVEQIFPKMAKHKREVTLLRKVIPRNLRVVKKDKVVPDDINVILADFNKMMSYNQRFDSYLGQGFYPTYVPPIIKRSVLENPRWYTAYTPYQSEIAQGRLECLFNYQLLVSRLTNMEVANASLLDEASAAGEAILMASRTFEHKKSTFLVLDHVFPATKAVLESIAKEVNIKLIFVPKITKELVNDHKQDLIGFMGQTPDRFGFLHDFTESCEQIHSIGGLSVIASDLLACVTMRPPGDMGADIVLGNGQRFGNPMGFGGPHAAFFATKKKFIRSMPGRLITVTEDVHGKTAYRMSLQTREQHIRREKATSNICTSQVLLANLNYFYSLYHGEKGLKYISNRVHENAVKLALLLEENGYEVITNPEIDVNNNSVNNLLAEANESKPANNTNNYPENLENVNNNEQDNQELDEKTQAFLSETSKIETTNDIEDIAGEPELESKKISNNNYTKYAFFDTLLVKVDSADEHVARMAKKGINIYRVSDQLISISLDETKTKNDLNKFIQVFCQNSPMKKSLSIDTSNSLYKENLQRPDGPLFRETDLFNQMKGEHELLRYITRLENKDVTLANSMIPLGSCTMKLNSAFEMDPLTAPKLDLHPFVPPRQALGYTKMLQELSSYLLKLTDMDGISYQSNSGATGEYLGLKVIKRFHESKGDFQRNIVLIPASAHGTNPASATKMGLTVTVVKTADNGYIDIIDLTQKIEQNKDRLFGLMMTYPSTHGVFEEETAEILEMIHQAGGQVYIDGANMNAQLGCSSPGGIGGDVCHLNLHKTFCIPHGGGGPGMGPVLVRSHLMPFLPGHSTGIYSVFGKRSKILSGSPSEQCVVAPFASTSILSISYLYIKAMGINGLRECSEQAIISANYLSARLINHYKVLFTNKHKLNAHEFILDIRDIKRDTGISEEDIAKRLMDFGFHAPTMSFPVAGTLMIEPTESENIEELDRFADALIKIREEIAAVNSGEFDKTDNPLKNAPHTLEHLLSNNWDHKYTREEAAYPLPWIRTRGKVWPSIGRINNIQGDRTLRTDY